MINMKTVLGGLIGVFLVFACAYWWYASGHSRALDSNHEETSRTQSDHSSNDEAFAEEGSSQPTSVSGLHALVVKGRELHSSLEMQQLESLRDLPTTTVPPANPHYSTDDEFVLDIARGSSQGRLDRNGIRSALYARYASGEGEVGLYGLETESDADADQREQALRKIWARNASLNRARVHRNDLLLVVVFTDGVSTDLWETVNSNVAKLLNTHRSL